MKEETGIYADILNKIFICLIVICALLAMLVILNLANGGSWSDRSSSGSSSSSEQSGDGEIEGMNSIDVAGAIELFDSKSVEIIYFGRPDCGACTNFLPVMLAVQENLEFETNYVNINLVESGDELSELIALMDKETTIGSGDEEQVGSFGSFFGTTPMVIAVQDGEIVDGIIGSRSQSSYEEFLASVGIE